MYGSIYIIYIYAFYWYKVWRGWRTQNSEKVRGNTSALKNYITNTKNAYNLKFFKSFSLHGICVFKGGICAGVLKGFSCINTIDGCKWV